MPMNSTTGQPLLKPWEQGDLITVPWRETSVALQVTTAFPTESPEVHLPVVAADVTSGFVPELGTIELDDPDLQTVTVVPRKLAAATLCSLEQLRDSNPQTQEVVGQSIIRSLARTTDKAFIAASTTNGPAGLGSLVGHGAQQVTVSGAITSLDPFTDAIGMLAEHGANLTAFLADARTVTALAKLKQIAGSNVPLLNSDNGVDVTKPQARTVQGVPLWSLPASAGIPPGHIWGLDRTRVYTVLRQGVELDVSTDAAFLQTAAIIRATTRIGFGFADPEAVVRITSSDGS